MLSVILQVQPCQKYQKTRGNSEKPFIQNITKIRRKKLRVLSNVRRNNVRTL